METPQSFRKLENYLQNIRRYMCPGVEGETFEWERESEKWQLQFRRFLGSPPKFFELHLIQKIVLSFHPLSITLGLLAWEFLGSDVLVQMLKMQGFRCENLHYLHSSKISNDIYL